MVRLLEDKNRTTENPENTEQSHRGRGFRKEQVIEQPNLFRAGDAAASRHNHSRTRSGFYSRSFADRVGIAVSSRSSHESSPGRVPHGAGGKTLRNVL